MTTPTPALWTPDFHPWLCQGDLFRVAPVVITTMRGPAGRDMAVEIAQAPALLATYDCALDKKNARGVMQATEVTLLPLRQMSALEGNRASIVRRNTLKPYDYFFVGDLPRLGETYVSLNNPSTVTLDYYAPELRLFAGEDETHLAATRHGERLGTLTPEQLELFRDKWDIHWTRRMPAP